MPPGSPDPAPAAGEVPVRPAATLMPVRDGERGLEVCLLRRNPNSTWVAGLALFAGGGVDARDEDPALTERCVLPAGGAPAGGLAPWIAALRETYEEIGFLLATDPAGSWAHQDAARHARLAAQRTAIDAGTVTFAAVLAREELQLRIDLMRFVAHWVTPPGQARRYDTRFYLAPAPPDSPADPDGIEIVGAGWIRPTLAIAQQEAGELPMLPPTLGALHWLAAYATVSEAIAAADALGEIPRYAPGSIGDAAVHAAEIADDPAAIASDPGHQAAGPDAPADADPATP
ncbi:MAG: NUDIX domain-containing protein [Solirubrobacteraceae bacterium]|nr:NUDIX domain-containing protein [Solirubrobacteraceae bacterium]